MSLTLKEAVHNVNKTNSVDCKGYIKTTLPCSRGFYATNIVKKNEDKIIYLLTNGKENRITKVYPVQDIGNEIELMDRLCKYDICPTITKNDIFSKEGTDYVYIEMERLCGTIEDILQYKLNDKDLDVLLILIIRLLKKLCELNISHGDFHWKNIGFKFDKNKNGIHLRLIDFEFGEFVCNPRLDVLQLIRSIDSKYAPNVNKDNREYLRNKLVDVYKNKFNKNFVITQVEKEFELLKK
jgi:hypothetical protein